MDTFLLVPATSDSSLLTPLLPAAVSQFITAHTTVFISFVACWLLYLLSRVVCPYFSTSYPSLGLENKVDWDSRIVSTVHAVVTTVGALICMITEDVYYTDPFQGYTAHGEIYAHIFIGYLLYDTILVVRYRQLRSKATIFHHTLGLGGYPMSIAFKQVQFFCLLWLFTEISTPFVNNRFFFSVSKTAGVKKILYNGMAMTITFVTTRALVVPIVAGYLVVKNWHMVALLAPQIKIGLAVCMGTVTILNYYWSYLIIRGLLKHMAKAGGKRDTRPNRKERVE